MYKRILCPIDGSDTSLHGMREAIALAKDQHAELILLHIIDNTIFLIYPPLLEGPYDEVRNYGRQMLDEALHIAQSQYPTTTAKLIEISTGRIGDAVLEQIASTGADLIVMGTHGRRGAALLALGSDANLVVANSKVPVLLVR